jgi:hypothetical protein
MALGRRTIEAKGPLHFGVSKRDQEVEVHGDSTTAGGLSLCVGDPSYLPNGSIIRSDCSCFRMIPKFIMFAYHFLQTPLQTIAQCAPMSCW